MALPVQTPRPAQELAAEFGIKGGMRLLLDEVIIPTRAIKDRPRKYAMGFGNVAAGGVGNRTEIALVNTFFPEPGIDGTVHVHSIWVASGVETNFDLAWPTVALAGFADLTLERFIDSRNNSPPQAALQEDNGSAITTATRFWRIQNPLVNTTVRTDFDPPLIIAPANRGPANALIIKPNTDNVALFATVLWSEPADPV